MKKYKVLKKFILGFINGNDQEDLCILPEDRVESDGETIWVTFSNGQKIESITTANIIDALLKDKKIERSKKNK